MRSFAFKTNREILYPSNVENESTSIKKGYYRTMKLTWHERYHILINRCKFQPSYILTTLPSSKIEETILIVFKMSV